MPLPTWQQYMDASYADLVALESNVNHNIAAKATEHREWRDACNVFANDVLSKTLSGPGKGIDTPPPPPVI